MSRSPENGQPEHSSTGLRFPGPLVDRLALVGATVVPMDCARVLPDQTVVVEHGIIRTVGPRSQVPVVDARVMDCSGRYVVPGLADMHVHCWEPTDVAMYLANGVTAIRNMRGAPLHLALADKVVRRELPGPRLVTASPLIDGVDAAGRTSRQESIVLSDPHLADPLVRRLAGRGYQQIKAYGRLRLEVLRALGAASADAGLRLAGHCPDGVSHEEAIAAGMSCLEHLTGIATGHLDVRGPAADEVGEPGSPYLRAARLFAFLDLDRIRRLAGQMAAQGIWSCPTLAVNSATARHAGRAVEDPLLRYAPLQLARRWSWLLRGRLTLDGAPRPQQARPIVERKLAMAREVVSILQREGAPLLVGTDARNPFVHPGFTVHDELAHFVEAGLTPYEALRCATSEAARFLGEADAWGTVAEGKRADLLVVDRDPLDDLSTLSRSVAVLVNGFCLERADLESLLSQRERWARRVEQLPTVALPPTAADEPRPLAEGTLLETRFGAPAVRTAYRHRRLPDGSHLIEESHAEAPSGAQGHRTLRLTSELTLQDGRYVLEGPAGREVHAFARRAEGRYEVFIQDVDGVTSTVLLDATDLLPSERLSVSFYPIAADRARRAGHLGGNELAVLSVDGGEARVLEVRLAALPAAPEEGRPGDSWCIDVARPGEPCTLVHRLDGQGRLVDVVEKGAPGDRRLVPERGGTGR